MTARAVTTTISTIIVDDEKLAQDELTYLLKDFPDVEILATADNGIEAVKLIETLEPDLVFLDVQMPGLDGLGVVRRLREREIPLPHFIFATAFDQYAVEAFRLEAMDYVLKPVERDRLNESLERARRAVSDRNAAMEAQAAANTMAAGAQRSQAVRTKLMVRAQNRNWVVDAQDLIYATIDDGVITAVTAAVEGLLNYKTLEELQQNLDGEMFWRVHRSYLVNVNRIKEVIPWFKSSFQIKMDDKRQTEIPVSRVQTKRLRLLFRM